MKHKTVGLDIRSVQLNDSREHIQRFFDIMIHAYRVTEVEIWGENYARMSREEFGAIIAKGELIGAWVDGKPVGSIYAYRIHNNAFAFGLFSVDFDYKGRAIGRQLIAAAETKANESGAKYMELEILRPKFKTLPQKKLLHEWYLRLGYQKYDTLDFEIRKPDKAHKIKNFVQPTVFDCYRKSL
jgi:GNAT superfamily N-acetyltransferase